jgi:hypothetical protein
MVNILVTHNFDLENVSKICTLNVHCKGFFARKLGEVA